MLKDNSQPPQPEWTKSFKSGVKSYRFENPNHEYSGTGFLTQVYRESD